MRHLEANLQQWSYVLYTTEFKREGIYIIVDETLFGLKIILRSLKLNDL